MKQLIASAIALTALLFPKASLAQSFSPFCGDGEELVQQVSNNSVVCFIVVPRQNQTPEFGLLTLRRFTYSYGLISSVSMAMTVDAPHLVVLIEDYTVNQETSLLLNGRRFDSWLDPDLANPDLLARYSGDITILLDVIDSAVTPTEF